MKKTASGTKRVLNHYSVWKYMVLLVTIVVLALSAIPTWYGEQPSIQIDYAQPSARLNDVLAMKNFLASQGISAQTISSQGRQQSLLFGSETQQTLAKTALDKVLSKDDNITFSYRSVAPKWLSKLGFEPIKLGLDLRGGVQFLLNVDVNKAFDEQRDALADDIRAELRQQHIRQVRVSSQPNQGVTVISHADSALDTVYTFVTQQYPGWNAVRRSNEISIAPTEQNKQTFQQSTLKQNLKIMRDRIAELGITEALVQRQGEHSIRIELPGVQDPAQAKKVIGATASLAFYEVVSDGSNHDTFTLADKLGRKVALARQPVLTGDHIINAQAGLDNMGMSEVNITLDHVGGETMGHFSATHIGKPMATVYREYKTNSRGETVRSERVISVATIQSQLGSQFRITGAGSSDEAQQLALLLRAGSLTAPITIVEERTIGASLGAENISNGFAALALGMGLTLTFMALWYRRLGWVANVALLANMVCLLGLIALLPGAVLTLPGIAGLVLTVGMAVDTNVLIFERIRDKLREGRSFAQAIDQGFSSAFATIWDANFTTMITAVVLYSIGNGPIQGFALTLGLGLMTSMFTGVFASRALVNLIWGRDTRRDVRV